MRSSSERVAEAHARLPEGVTLHARPAGALVLEASRFDAEVAVTIGERRANAKSILEVLSLGACGGAEVRVTASGQDAAQAVARLAEVLPQLR